MKPFSPRRYRTFPTERTHPVIREFVAFLDGNNIPRKVAPVKPAMLARLIRGDCSSTLHTVDKIIAPFGLELKLVRKEK